MRKTFLLLLCIVAFITNAASQTPALGNYPATTAREASNISVNPSAAPANTVRITASAPSRFKGLLSINPATGVLKITNARPAGTYIITIKAINGGASATTSFQLQVNSPLCNTIGQFGTPPASVATGNGAWSVRVADFNNDGKQDLAVVNYNSNSVSIRLGNGTGGFSSTTDVTVDTRPNSVTIADFNGDGNQDFVATNITSNTISLRLGNGNGTFSNAPDVVAGTNPRKVVTGDFNNDGIIDLLVANYSSVNSIAVCMGNGTGGFTVTNTLSSIPFPADIATGDFNGDGLEDFAVVTNTSYYKILVYKGTGLGNFAFAQEIYLSGYPGGIVVADFNNDGNQDIAITVQQSSTVIAYAGSGNGTFTQYFQLALYGSPSELSTGDFNGDSLTDLITGTGTDITILYNYGNSFSNYPINVGHSANSSVTVGDFDGDGRSDFISNDYLSNYVSVVKASAENISVTGNGVIIPSGDSIPSLADSTDFGIVSANTIRSFTIINTGTAPLNVNSIEFSGPDAASFSMGGTGSYNYYIQPGNTTTFPVLFAPTSAGAKTAIIKLNTSICSSPAYSFTLRATAATTNLLGSYTNLTVGTAGNISIIPSAAPAAVTNITATTSPTFKGVLTVNPATGAVTVQNAHPAGVYVVAVRAFTSTAFFVLTVTSPACSQSRFAGTTNTAISYPPRGVAVGDFNGDGRPDVISANSSGYSVSVLLGNSSGGVGSPIYSYVNGTPVAIAVADFNSDGKLDYAAAHSNYGVVSVGFGDGTGNFSAIKEVAVGKGPQSIAVGDFNRDGKMDFATASSTDSTISIRLSNGVGGFVAATDMKLGLAPFGIAAADFDNDSRTDLIVTSFTGNTATLFMGDGNGGFTATATVPAGTNPRFILTGDFNRDGNPDFATANSGSNTVSVRIGDGAGGFTNAADVSAGTTPYAIAPGDFNGDGQPDLAISNFGGANVSIRLGDGMGSFSNGANVATASGPVAIAVADFNGDGRQDWATANASAGNLSIRLAGAGSAEIELKGNGSTIPDGSTTPLPGNNTDFSDTAMSINRSFLIQNTGTGPLTVNRIAITGTDSAAFVLGNLMLPQTIAAGRDTTFIIHFTASGTVLKTATVSIYNDDCDEAVYDFAVQGRQRMPGAALAFDGVDDYITINDTLGNVGTSDATLSAWARTNAAGAATLISKQNTCTGGSGMVLSLTTSGRASVRFTDNTSSQQLTSGQVVNDNLWHQLTAVRQGDTLRLYVDGFLDTATITTGIAAINNNALLTIGASGCSSMPDYFRGQMDEVKLYNRALGTAEIQRHTFCELDTSRRGLLAYYTFNQGFTQESNASVIALADSAVGRANGLLRNFALMGTASNWVAPGAVLSGTTCTGRSVWLGLTSNWDDPANWSGRFVPSELTKVVISGSLPLMPEVTSPTSTCYSLTLLNGATVRVRTGGHLTIQH